MIEVLLLQRVERLGGPGDVVRVAEGYARNYLFPKGLAVVPTPHNLERFKRLQERRARGLQEREAWAREAQAQLDGYVLKFARKTHHGGRLYSSVRSEEIADQIQAELGLELEKGRIDLEAPIDRAGTHTVTIHLYKGLAAQVRVVVEPEEASAASHG